MASKDLSEAMRALIIEFHLALASLNESDCRVTEISPFLLENRASVTREDERERVSLCSKVSLSETGLFLFCPFI